MKKRNVYIDNIEDELAIIMYRDRLRIESQSESVPLEESHGRVTAVAVYAKKSSPHYNSAAMDGILVRSKDTEGASEVRPVELKEGEDFVYVNTGNPILEGFDSVIMIEDVIECGDGRVKINKSSHPWQYIRNIGEDIVVTEMIIPSNHEIRAIDLGALAAGGIEEIEVYKKPVVGIVPTGSEIVKSATTDIEGEITDSNSLMFAGLVREYGGEPHRIDPVRDEYELLKEKISTEVDRSDILIINAGSSAGTKDYTKSIIEELGEVVVHGIAVKPGKPTILGIIRNKAVVGLPGYPVSSYIAFETFVKPILLDYSGKRKKPSQVEAILSKRVYSSLKHKELIRVSLGVVNGKLIATPISGGAGATMSLVKADGIGIVPREVEGIESGDKISVQLLKPYDEIEDTLVSIGSHDMVMDILGDMMRVSSAHTGSLGGIISMKKKESHVAPIHLLDESTGEYNISYVKKYFPGGGMSLIKGVQRVQGFIVPKGNPKQIQSVKDLSRGDIVFVNRQRGSGTRILLDYHISREGVDTEAIDGYDLEYNTHMDIAQAVKSGNADVGLGIASAAYALGLDFVELADEEYDFLVYTDSLKEAEIEKFIEILRSEEFKKRVAEIPGYKTDRAGEVVEVN
ncbi:molybdopterin molybdenumtransferase [Andreesenia angusta]|uniref:Molybdopterin molybdenumtransferase n=1 Tax=Andreesenia angusta TaxID=39480 RepID=A0A1S1V4A2_9FIRM|nr:molybdopterin biosynthesis protein [Andreesenia angusta]OHW61348.1 molybdopterin molybdenumtransferase [Andreesenia angusta]